MAMSASGALAAGGAAAATASAAGIGLFSYNRGNYTMDQKQHFTRYLAGLNMAIAQTKQYRADITDLAALTIQRMDAYHGLAAMSLTILTAIFCPGRLGLHTPPPPQWLMGLAMVNIAGAYLWLILTMWLGMHASLRADSASTHMLTRFVRLPVPSQGHIDKARKFLSSFEEQPLKEAFRVPFFRHHNKKEGEHYNEFADVDLDAERRMRHGSDVPAWFCKEKAIDGGAAFESMMPIGVHGSAPEHFEVFREVQNEWWPYDVYTRISIFLAFMHLIHCWTFMQIGHGLTETRSVFAVACVVLPMFVLQMSVLALDVLPVGDSGMNQLHKIGPFSTWVAYAAACLEYKRWYTPGGMAASITLVYIAYGIHLIFTLRLYWLCAPDLSGPPKAAEASNATWWPQHWHLPSAFAFVTWLVAPPGKLEAGQHDLVGEIRDAAAGRGLTADGDRMVAEVLPAHEDKRRDVHNALGKQGESPAWFSVKIGLLAMTAAWIWMIIGFSVEVATQGTAHPSFLNAPGMPNNLRDPRYRKPKPGHHEPVEVGTGGSTRGPAVGISEEGVQRRLQELVATPELLKLAGNDNAARRQEIGEKIREMLPHLQELASGRQTNIATVSPANSRFALLAQPPQASVPLAIQWPALFEPRVLACGPTGAQTTAGTSVALAISRYGRGAIIGMSAQGHSELTQFTLEGVVGFGPLTAATWDDAGLLLTSATGTAMECPGRGPSQGQWRCQPIEGADLPISLASRPFSGTMAISRHPKEGGLRAAIVYPGEPTMTIFSRSNRASAPWLPAGEVRIRGSSEALSLMAEDALMLSKSDGSVLRMRLSDGTMRVAAAAVQDTHKHTWQAACGLPGGGVVRLAMKALSHLTVEPVLHVARG